MPTPNCNYSITEFILMAALPAHFLNNCNGKERQNIYHITLFNSLFLTFFIYWYIMYHCINTCCCFISCTNIISQMMDT